MGLSKAKLQASSLALLALSVFATSFLNFGLAVLLGGLGLVAAAPSRLASILVLPSTLLLLAASFAKTRGYALEILQMPFGWNFGVPFVLVQPLFIQMLILERPARAHAHKD